ncbi:MAG: hypothetical protein J6Y19_05830 [Kiritimatiellae bacterium]|nr:hypothetical protein [Kiritimatiellia bacterium]
MCEQQKTCKFKGKRLERCRLTPSQVDAGMARRGYEVAWHGTVGKWKTPDFGSPHGVPAFYLSVERGPAESYAVLRHFDAPEEKPRVKKFYVALRNVWVLRENGRGFKGCVEDLAKAKAHGYDVVKVLGALDDQYFRIGKRGEITTLPGANMDDEAGPTDILIVLNPDALVSESDARSLLSEAAKPRRTSLKTASRRALRLQNK